VTKSQKEEGDEKDICYINSAGSGGDGVSPTSMVAADAPIDYTPPITIKDYGDPYYTDGVNEWITADTPILPDCHRRRFGSRLY